MPEQIRPFKVRKLPLEVEAMPTTGITGATLEDVAAWCGGHVIAGHTGQPDRKTGIAILVPTLEGDMVANFGDWIVKGVEGEFHPVRGAIFTKAYEMVEGPADIEPVRSTGLTPAALAATGGELPEAPADIRALRTLRGRLARAVEIITANLPEDDSTYEFLRGEAKGIQFAIERLDEALEGTT